MEFKPGPVLECGCSSGVEHNLAKVGVVGSNPIARSKFLTVHHATMSRPRASGAGTSEYVSFSVVRMVPLESETAAALQGSARIARAIAVPFPCVCRTLPNCRAPAHVAPR